MTATTVGSILINSVLPPTSRDYEKPMGAKEMKGALMHVAQNHPAMYGQVAKSLKDLGDLHSYLEGSSFSFDDAKPQDTSEIFKKYDGAFHKTRSIEDTNKREHAQRAINTEIEKEINTLVEKDMATNPTRIHKWSTIGGKGNKNNIRQMFYASGNQLDVTNKVLPYMSRSNFSAGLSPSDAFISATGARKGIVESFISVRDPGALGKEFFMLTNSMITTEHDCGTKEGMVIPVSSSDALDRHLAKDVGVFKRNDVVTHVVQAQLTKAGVKSIDVRTPLKCLAKHGVCSMCLGIMHNGKLSPIGDTVGLYSSQALTEKLTQMALSAKHTGGVVGKVPSFQIVKQLLHVPENFPNGAVLAQQAGTIHKIDELPDGGKRLWIGTQSHYVLPKVELKVKRGDNVGKGDSLSDGLINPAEIVRLKGMDAGRAQLAKGLQETYAGAGIAGQAKVFETVARAILCLGEVADPGDHTQFNIGDKVNWDANRPYRETQHATMSPKEAVGWRLTTDHPRLHMKAGDMLTPDHLHLFAGMGDINVYKKPAIIEPKMWGTERAAIYGGDWISNLGFRFVKDQLKENVATGSGVDLNSNRPIPNYVMGTIGHGRNGNFSRS